MTAILPKTQVHYLSVSAEQAGQRIDNFLQNQLKNIPKSHIYRILRTGEVRVNKGRIKPTYRVQMGDEIRLPPLQMAETETPSLPHAGILAQLSAAILHEDKQLLVVNKPAGMAVHGGSGVQYGVIEGLRALYPDAPYLELVHRLDRDTSGCLMIARRSSMLRRLHEQLRTGQLHKKYVALAAGRWPNRCHTVNAPLKKNTLQSGERMVRVTDDGKAAVSQFKVLRHFPQHNATWIQVEPLTGRTHQIRVHAAHAGHPLAGDEKYGIDDFNQKMRQLGLKRLFLHAQSLTIDLPDNEYHLEINAPLPPELQQFLDKLS
jgi:23S rRNA pseudouridine955/2504/2580 synthase